MSGSSEMLRDFNAPNRLKLGWMGPKSVVTYDAATGGVEDWAGASLPGTAFVSALNLGPAMDRHLLLKIPCPTCTSAYSRFSHDDGNIYVSFRGNNAVAAGSTYGVGNTGSGINTFEGGACTNRNLKLRTNGVYVHYQRTYAKVSETELWTMLSEGESYEIDGAALVIHVCTVGTEAEGMRPLSESGCTDLDGDAVDTDGLSCARGYSGGNTIFCDRPDYTDDTDFSASTMCCSCGGGAPDISELDAMVTVGADLVAAKALCTAPGPPAPPPEDMCGLLEDAEECQIQIKNEGCKNKTTNRCKKKSKKCKKDSKKKKLCQKTCCKLGFPI